MDGYMKYLPLMGVVARYPDVIQAGQASIPDVQNIVGRFPTKRTQQFVAEFMAMLRQIEGVQNAAQPQKSARRQRRRSARAD